MLRHLLVMFLSLCMVAGLTALAAAAPDAGGSYPVRAGLEQYGVPAAASEVTLARSAAPASIAADADVLTLGPTGYETAAHGHNGFVCLVERSWAAGFKDKNFWNPHLRAPICLNPAAARSVLPAYLERTRWALAGVSREDMLERTRRAVVDHTYTAPAPGAMGFMLSRLSFLDDVGGHWHPHLMLFMPRMDPGSWGGNIKGSGVIAEQGDPEPATTLFVPVPRWSDGTADAAPEHEGH